MARPNGLVITSAHDVLVAETLGNHVIAFQIGNDGALLHRRVFANFERRSPLGICADSEGGVGGRCSTVAFCSHAARRACHSSRP